jgi:transcription elongation GreA/GreB family factor
MSRAFVKEDAAVQDVVDRPISPHPNYVTADGLAQIERALEAAQEAHGVAQASGHRAELVKAWSELRYWTARRSSARVATPDPIRDTVQFGSIVTIVRNGRKQDSDMFFSMRHHIDQTRALLASRLAALRV